MFHSYESNDNAWEYTFTNRHHSEPEVSNDKLIQKLTQQNNDFELKIKKNNDKLAVLQDPSLLHTKTIELWRTRNLSAPDHIFYDISDVWFEYDPNKYYHKSVSMYVNVQHIQDDTFLLTSFCNPIKDTNDEDYVLKLALYEKIQEMTKDVFPLKFHISSISVRMFDNGSDDLPIGLITEPNRLGFKHVQIDNMLKSISNMHIRGYNNSALDKKNYPTIKVYLI